MKTQNRQNNFFYFLLVFILFPAFSPSAESQPLAQADSLYNRQEYVSAFRIYNEIFKDNKKASPAMLLKMAFIQEGLGNYDQTIFFLYKYYYLTHDQGVLNKIQQIAENQNLEGYTLNEFSAIKNFIFEYRHFIAMAFLLLALINSWYMVYLKRKANSRLYGNAITNLFLLVLIWGVLQISPNKFVLFKDSPSYVMTGPSAGAEVISISGKGSKAQILKEQDVWYQVKWHGEKAYIRNNQVLVLSPE